MITIHDFAEDYVALKNEYNMDGHDAAILVMARAIFMAGNFISYSINRCDEAMTPGEGLALISDHISDIASAIVSLEVNK